MKAVQFPQDSGEPIVQHGKFLRMTNLLRLSYIRRLDNEQSVSITHKAIKPMNALSSGGKGILWGQTH